MTRPLVVAALCVALLAGARAAEHPEEEQSAAEPARRLPQWSYERLAAASDVVAVVEPLENRSADDAYAGDTHGRAASDFAAVDTRFRVQAALQGAAPRELTVLHFGYGAGVSRSGQATFVSFLTGPLQYEKRVVRPGRTPLGDVTLGPALTFFGQRPTWLAFLKRREDGRFEPVTGQYDSAFSFRELHAASFYAAP